MSAIEAILRELFGTTKEPEGGHKPEPPQYSINDQHDLRAADTQIGHLAMALSQLADLPWRTSFYERGTQHAVNFRWIQLVSDQLSKMSIDPCTYAEQSAVMSRATIIYANYGSTRIESDDPALLKTLTVEFRKHLQAQLASRKLALVEALSQVSSLTRFNDVIDPSTYIPTAMCGQCVVVFDTPENSGAFVDAMNAHYLATVEPARARLVALLASSCNELKLKLAPK